VTRQRYCIKNQDVVVMVAYRGAVRTQ